MSESAIQASESTNQVSAGPVLGAGPQSLALAAGLGMAAELLVSALVNWELEQPRQVDAMTLELVAAPLVLAQWVMARAMVRKSLSELQLPWMHERQRMLPLHWARGGEKRQEWSPKRSFEGTAYPLRARSVLLCREPLLAAVRVAFAAAKEATHSTSSAELPHRLQQLPSPR